MTNETPGSVIRSIQTRFRDGSVGAKTEWNDQTLQRLIKMAATSIDFDKLIADGVLRKHGKKYELLDLARLPEHARRKIRLITTSRKTSNPIISFIKPSKQTIRQAKKMGLLPPN